MTRSNQLCYIDNVQLFGEGGSYGNDYIIIGPFCCWSVLYVLVVCISLALLMVLCVCLFFNTVPAVVFCRE